MRPQRVATVASPMYMRSLMKEEQSMNREVKPPKMIYTKCGLVIDRCSQAMAHGVDGLGIWRGRGRRSEEAQVISAKKTLDLGNCMYILGALQITNKTKAFFFRGR